MRKSLEKLTVCLATGVLFTFFSCRAFAQSFLVHQYSELDGLPSSYVHDITQDRWGRIWMATRAGIGVYDGVSWEKFTAAEGLPVLSFLKITIDRQGRVWALGDPAQGGIYAIYYDGVKWKSIPGPIDEAFKFCRVSAIALLEQEEPGSMPMLAIATIGQGILLHSQHSWHYLNQHNGLISNSVNGMISWRGKLFAATDKGLSIISPSLEVDNRLNPGPASAPPPITGITVQYHDKFPDSPLKSSRVWLCGNNWLGYIDSENKSMTHFEAGMHLSGKEPVVHLLPDYRGGIYVGDRYLLNYLNYKSGWWELVDAPNGLIGGGTNSLFLDFEKNIWIACDRGVSKISSRRFTNFQRFHGLYEDEVAAVLEYEPGKFILGHNNGVTFYDGKEFLTVPFSRGNASSSQVSRVLEMETDGQNNIWMAVSWGGLARIDPHRPQKITWYGQAQGLPEKISCLWIDKSTNRLWLGTEKGIFLLNAIPSPAANPQEKFILTELKEFSGRDSRRIYGDSGRLCWVASNSNGVYIYNKQKKQWKNYVVPGDSRASAPYAIKKDNAGRFFVGTLAGLFIIENESLKKFAANGFHLDRPVFFIIGDAKNRLWFGTDNGVVRWDGNETRTFSTAEGLIGQETNRAAAITDSQGRVWIGTNRGLSIYNEQWDNTDLYNPPPRVHLTYLQAADVRMPLQETEPLRLSYHDNTLVFHFRGISFIDEAAIRFKYKLEGFEEKWSEENYPYKQMVQYIKLPPGSYRFHLKARNAIGVWSEEVLSPLITIMSPFYRTWWFYLLALGTFAGLLYGLFRFFSQKQYAALLEKQVEERTHRLHSVEKRYQDLFEESKDVVFMTTSDGKLLDVNPAGIELFGFDSKEEALAVSSIKDIYYNPADRDIFRKEIEKKGYVKDYEVMLRRQGGESVTALVTASLVRTPEGESIGFRGIIRDISRQKRLELQLAQAQKMEAIGTLAGGIAHDFNNILGAIVGYTELALDDLPQDTAARQNVRHILTGAERAAELVKQILAFSRQNELERKPLVLSEIIKEALKLLRSSLPASIEIRQHLRGELGTILGNPTQIHQVMMNLGANAGHAMQEKGGILEVSLDEVSLDEDTARQYNLKPGPYLRLAVSDTGHGIPQPIIKRIFEPYFTTKKTGEGTGMGLAVIHGIVKSHGGDISVYSEPAEGTTFVIFFPTIEDVMKPEKPLVQGAPGGSERILLVEDEESLKEVGKQILQRMGYQVTGLSDPIAALELFQEGPHHFDLIISDISMPHLTGIQLTGEIRRIRPDIPVILCSGFSSAMTEEQIKALGATDFVLKPIVRNELAKIIRNVLDNRKK